ncbi:hypothetical protein H8I91_18685 [Serratia fonticola]|uniref:hypothetical protein n=1 Tax=Serratia fonticola TaxID=47917 RepID=UPI0016451D11|nr:hypothetical protein [Serratia fonticola]MBC3252297.1 hypothetical protein [Serratia fonticola]
MNMKKNLMLLRPVAAIIMLGVGLSGAAHAVGFENPGDANVTFTVNKPTVTLINFAKGSSVFEAGLTAKDTLIGTVDISNTTEGLIGVQWVNPIPGTKNPDTTMMTADDGSGVGFTVVMRGADGKAMDVFNVNGTNGQKMLGNSSDLAVKHTDIKFKVLTLNEETIPAGNYSAEVIGSSYY